MNTINFSHLPILGFLNNPTALAILLLVVVLLFGSKNIPELMKGVGQGIREFKKGMETEDETISPARIAEQEQEARLQARIEQEVRARMQAEQMQKRD